MADKPDKKYGTVAGIVQFDPSEREVGEDQIPVRDLRIRALGTQYPWDVTLFPQWEALEVEKGDFVVADGEVRVRKGTGDHEGRTFRSITPYTLHVNGSRVFPADREVEGGGSSDAADSDEPF